MNLKSLGLKEWLVVLFIATGLVAFAAEKKLAPKEQEVKGVAAGFNGDITLTVKAYKKGDKVVITNLDVAHTDTPAIAGPAVEQLKAAVLNKQSADIDGVSGATYTSTGFKEALEKALADVK